MTVIPCLRRSVEQPSVRVRPALGRARMQHKSSHGASARLRLHWNMWPDPPAVMPESSGLDPGGEAVVDCSRSNQIGGTCEAKGSVSDEREENLIAGGGGPIHQEGTGGTPCGAQSVKGEVST